MKSRSVQRTWDGSISYKQFKAMVDEFEAERFEVEASSWVTVSVRPASERRDAITNVVFTSNAA